MAKDYKYKDSTPVDEPIPKGKVKAVEPGSGIRVAPEKKYSYGYTIADDADPTKADQSGDKFDVKKLMRGRAELIESTKPDRKAMRYLEDPSSSGNDEGGGAGRGKQGGPTAKELGMASGGSASSRADGIASKGKTRGKMC
jgi:hypothetical protein